MIGIFDIRFFNFMIGVQVWGHFETLSYML